MSTEHLVVIGNGPAGNEAAHTLREKFPEARITLISKTVDGCFKPRLLPDHIAGKIEEDALYETARSEYKQKGIRLRCGQRVVDLNIHKRELLLDHREILPFSGLIIAVGGKPRIPEPLHVFKDLMVTLKTVEDARAWIEKLAHVDSVLVMGGDLTSLAVTKALLHLGTQVYFMLDEDAFWPLRPNNELLVEVGRRLAERGVEMLPWSRLRRVARLSENLLEVQADAQRLQVGMIGAFFGLTPDIGFLARSGLAISRGVLVDEYLNTGFEDIYATGDCAQVYHPQIRDYWVSIGHENAIRLGRIAAMNLVGGKVSATVAKESIYKIRGIKVNTSWWTEF
jgi:NAD(P)H-nitrite reductase large subunit